MEKSIRFSLHCSVFVQSVHWQQRSLLSNEYFLLHQSAAHLASSLRFHTCIILRPSHSRAHHISIYDRTPRLRASRSPSTQSLFLRHITVLLSVANKKQKECHRARKFPTWHTEPTRASSRDRQTEEDTQESGLLDVSGASHQHVNKFATCPCVDVWLHHCSLKMH